MRTIIVTGDLVEDYNLIQHPAAPYYHHVPFMHTVMTTQHGGAWYLQSLIKMVCNGKDVSVRGVKPEDISLNRCAGQAYSIWAPFGKDKGGPTDQTKVWRISQFLGCQSAISAEKTDPLSEPGAEKETSGRSALCAACQMEDSPTPDVVVLDDLGLGFRDRPELWPTAIRNGASPKKIVLKTTSPLGRGRLWDHLFEHHADRLTVVLSAEMLRGRGAAISTALSWDKTIEETTKEFEAGLSALDLARCRRVVIHFSMEGAVCFTRCSLGMGIEEVGPGGCAKEPAVDSEKVVKEHVRFERFVYDPDLHEGGWKAYHPGGAFGATSILTACLVRHELEPLEFPIFIAVGRALSAMRANHLHGGGADANFKPEQAIESIRRQVDPVDPKEDPARKFKTAFPHALLSDKVLRDQKPEESDLLRDLTGVGLDYVAAVATDVVLRGPTDALRRAPKAKYGKYLTVDREEIERINAISNLIRTYLTNMGDRRPLSLAVFGPPGSGKSFAIKELASDLFGAARAVLEFNLSQFNESSGDLHSAFHLVRDAAVHGKIPLVFWDEFDTDNLKWLKYFLAPMNDAEFRAANILHPFGKAIFVFAGGTAATFEEFIAGSRDVHNLKQQEAPDFFKEQKGPDFVSRLRGYVNIKGPNPTDIEHPNRDPAYLVRRAIVLRSVLERFYGHLIGKDKRALVSTAVIHGFLRAEEFRHGARSLQAIVEMSDLNRAQRFGVAALAPRDLLRLHVSDDFMERVLEGQLEEPLIEALAEACHTAWYEERYEKGWRYADIRDDRKLLHPLMLPYAQLDERAKERSRPTARLVQAKLRNIGYRIARRSHGEETKMVLFTDDQRRELMRIEHDIWLREHLLDGYQWSETSVEGICLHRDVAPFENVPPEDQDLDRAIVESIPPTLWKHGYTLVKI